MSIDIENLVFSYDSRVILDRMSLSINRSEPLSILGPNGAGKTTFLNTVAGLLEPSSGNITYDGMSRKKLSAVQMALLVGYVPQLIVPSFDYSVLDYVVTGCAPQIGTFSRPGEAHFRIARVIAQRPAYILMDEPTSHLDYGNQIRVLKTIKKLSSDGFGVVFTTHNPDHVLLLSGNVAIIDRKGQLHFGRADEMINEAVISELYGTEICLLKPENSERRICYSPGLD